MGRPPFRFLHDVVSKITGKTGFAEGLYDGDYLNARAIQGKEMKLNYLDKIVKCVGIAQGFDCEVRTTKVVAGTEAEQTNVFLQQLGTVATRNDLDFANIVQRTLGNTAIESKQDAAPEAQPDEGKSSGANEDNSSSGGASKMDSGRNEEAERQREAEQRQRETDEADERKRRKEARRAKEDAEAAADATARR